MTDYFGYLTQTPSIRLIQAIEESSILTIPRTCLQQLFATSNTWNTIGRQLAEQAYLTAVERANRMLHDEPTTRVRDFMKQHPDLLQRVPQYLIASYLQMTPETLSRVKKRLMSTKDWPPSIHDAGTRGVS
jgi:CRP-like cAMP-binding protein